MNKKLIISKGSKIWKDKRTDLYFFEKGIEFNKEFIKWKDIKELNYPADKWLDIIICFFGGFASDTALRIVTDKKNYYAYVSDLIGLLSALKKLKKEKLLINRS